MKTKQLFILGLLGLSGLMSNAQNIQSNALGTSGGLNAGTTASGIGGNAFYGYQAGKINAASGYGNCFIGSNSGMSNTIGPDNTFIGTNAGIYNTTGQSNIFIGAGAGDQNESGSGNVYIGVNSGYETNDNGGASGNVFIGTSSGFTEPGNNKLVIGNSEDSQLIWGDFTQNQLKFNAKVGIGYGFGNYPTTSGSVNLSNYNLFVKGGILTEEVRVSLASTWADYVFANDYKLPTLHEVEKQIQEKGHLANVPSAKEIKENGIELGEMAKIQQEKIEELTLYVIEQNKINEVQNKEIQELKAIVKSMLGKTN